MNNDLKEVILEALLEAFNALSEMDSRKLKNISDYTLHYAGIFQDPESINMAIVIYSLGKIVDRRNLYKHIKWDAFKNRMLKRLKAARDALERGKDVSYSNHMKNIMKELSKVEAKFGDYITEVIKQAKIKKGSKVFEHGISAGRTAEIMGISAWELMDYVGHTRIMDRTPMVSIPPRKRIKEARRLFNLE